MFNISIEQTVLMKALEYLEPTVGKNQTGLGDNCISMKTTGNGSVEMYTTNSIEFTKLEAIVAVGGNTQEQAPYVDFKRFKGIIASIPENEVISIEANVNDLLINFALKKTPIKLVGCNNGIIPLPNNAFPSSSMVSVPKNVMLHASNCVSSIITDTVSTPIYNCMRIYTTAMSVEVTALDMTGKRTIAYTDNAITNNPTAEILIEASKLKKSMKLFEDFNEMEMYMDANMVRIDGADIVSQYSQKTKGMISEISYFARRLNGAFPTNIKSNFLPSPTEFIELNKDELFSVFSRVKSIEDKSNNGQIGFEVNGGNCIITASTAHGNIEDVVNAENSVTTSFKTTFKYDNLSDIMKVITTDTVEIGVLPNHPNNFVVKNAKIDNMVFTVPGMVPTVTP